MCIRRRKRKFICQQQDRQQGKAVITFHPFPLHVVGLRASTNDNNIVVIISGRKKRRVIMRCRRESLPAILSSSGRIDKEEGTLIWFFFLLLLLPFLVIFFFQSILNEPTARVPRNSWKKKKTNFPFPHCESLRREKKINLHDIIHKKFQGFPVETRDQSDGRHVSWSLTTTTVFRGAQQLIPICLRSLGKSEPPPHVVLGAICLAVWHCWPFGGSRKWFTSAATCSSRDLWISICSKTTKFPNSTFSLSESFFFALDYQIRS